MVSSSQLAFLYILQRHSTKLVLEDKPSPPPTGSSANLFPWICWGLWINRNLHTFENKQNTPLEVISKVIAFLREWETAQTSIAQLPSNPPPQLPSQISSPSTIICNTDAAWCKETREAGMAWIFTSQGGREINRGCAHQPHVSSLLMAEALAVREALEHANTIWLRSDCKGLFKPSPRIKDLWSSTELFPTLNRLSPLSFLLFTHRSSLGF